MSKYQLGTLLFLLIFELNALSEKLMGANPGGHDKHFCEPLYNASILQSSIFTSIPPKLVTASTRNIVSAFPRSCPISLIGFLTPVEVSA